MALDPDAVVAEDTAQLLIDQLTGDLGFMTGLTGKAEALAKPATVQVEGSRIGLVTVKVGSPTR